MSLPGFMEWLENATLDHVLGGPPFSPPPAYYFGLSLRWEAVTEPPASAGYARVPYANTADRWVSPQTGYKANAYAVQFPDLTADWGEIQAMFLSDAPVGGRILALSPITKPRPFRLGDFAPAIFPGSFMVGFS